MSALPCIKSKKGQTQGAPKNWKKRNGFSYKTSVL